MNGFALIVILIVWISAAGMILDSHDVGTKIAGYAIALGCAYLTFKITTSNDNDEEKK